jgi:DNA ligase-associated metallophosphoesterase
VASALQPDPLRVRDDTTVAITIAGRQFVADRSGALYWPGRKVLIVSDLHLEKGSAFARRGQFVPPYDTRETLLRLVAAVDLFEPETIISLGDSFHDVGGAGRLCEADRKILHIIQDQRSWYWVTGNHDPEIGEEMGGQVVADVEIGGILFKHEPTDAPATHEIAGHLHPAAKLAAYGARLRRSCFVGNGQRLIMPAFGAYTGGLNVLDPAFDRLFADGARSVWMRGDDGLYPVPTRQLCPDRG